MTRREITKAINACRNKKKDRLDAAKLAALDDVAKRRIVREGFTCGLVPCDWCHLFERYEIQESGKWYTLVDSGGRLLWWHAKQILSGPVGMVYLGTQERVEKERAQWRFWDWIATNPPPLEPVEVWPESLFAVPFDVWAKPLCGVRSGAPNTSGACVLGTAAAPGSRCGFGVCSWHLSRSDLPCGVTMPLASGCCG